LPNGASTEATLSNLNSKVITTTNGIKTDNSAVTQPISATTLPLPNGASTETTLNAVKTSIDTVNTTIIDGNLNSDTLLQNLSNKLPATLGQNTSNNSLTVTIASDQTPLPINISADKFAQIVDDQTSIIYIGNAAIGSLPSASVWSIKKITFTGNLINTEWASSSDLFNKIWDNRSTYNYG
jgi:hypothetical protein